MNKNIYAAGKALKTLKRIGINQSELAKRLGLTKGAVHQWRVNGIPSRHCYELEKLMIDAKTPMTRIEMRPSDWKKYWPELDQNSSSLTCDELPQGRERNA